MKPSSSDSAEPEFRGVCDPDDGEVSGEHPASHVAGPLQTGISAAAQLCCCFEESLCRPRVQERETDRRPSHHGPQTRDLANVSDGLITAK